MAASLVIRPKPGGPAARRVDPEGCFVFDDPVIDAIKKRFEAQTPLLIRSVHDQVSKPHSGSSRSRLPNYWHALNVRGSTATVLPPTVSVNAAVVCSDGEQSGTPPDDGTKANPSIL